MKNLTWSFGVKTQKDITIWHFDSVLPEYYFIVYFIYLFFSVKETRFHSLSLNFLHSVSCLFLLPITTLISVGRWEAKCNIEKAWIHLKIYYYYYYFDCSEKNGINNMGQINSLLLLLFVYTLSFVFKARKLNCRLIIRVH